MMWLDSLPQHTHRHRENIEWLKRKLKNYPFALKSHPVLPRPDKVHPTRYGNFVRAPFRGTDRNEGVAIWLFEKAEYRDEFVRIYPSNTEILEGAIAS